MRGEVLVRSRQGAAAGSVVPKTAGPRALACTASSASSTSVLALGR